MELILHWTVHHCNSWKQKTNLMSLAIFYFTSYALNMFRTLIYPSSGACDYSVELPHWSYCSWFIVCWWFGVVGLEWYPKHVEPIRSEIKNSKWHQVGLLFSNGIKFTCVPTSVPASLTHSWRSTSNPLTWWGMATLPKYHYDCNSNYQHRQTTTTVRVPTHYFC